MLVPVKASDWLLPPTWITLDSLDQLFTYQFSEVEAPSETGANAFGPVAVAVFWVEGSVTPAGRRPRGERLVEWALRRNEGPTAKLEPDDVPLGVELVVG